MARVITYSTRLGAMVSKRVKGTTPTRFHIISAGSKSGWDVVSENSSRSIRKFRTKKEALTFARRYGQPKSVDKVIVHNRDGRIQNVVKI